MPQDSPSASRVALVGSYVPRQCGIATFTADLTAAITGTPTAAGGRRDAMVVAMDDQPEGYGYPPEVRFQISAAEPRQYDAAADLLNINRVDAVVLQHEYGIYGGKDGHHVLALLRNLRMPVISTLHTALTEPTSSQRAILGEVIAMSDRVVVMTEKAAQILREVYAAPDQKIAVIPHGIPDVPFTDPAFFKDQFDVAGRPVMLTFGLLSPGKGIETAIEALPGIVDKHPDFTYIVLGATHPHIVKQEGHAYRHKLESLAEKLGVRDNVRFHNRFVSLDELVGYLGAADLYVAPYPKAAQITSGTLAYAAGAGKAVVSTPFWHAEELLADGRGRLFPFQDAAALADHVLELLENPAKANAMRKQAYLHGRAMTWPQVGQRYGELLDAVVAERRDHPKPAQPRRHRAMGQEMPEFTLAHLRRLTDDTGIYQHAVYSLPDRRHGYCTDDNCRALIAALMAYDLQRDATVLPLIDRYLSFLHHAFNPDNGRFINFMSFDRRWLEPEGAQDVHGRTIWSLGVAVDLAPNDNVMALATQLIDDALPAAEKLGSVRSWAFTLLGLHAYLGRFSADTRARRLRDVLARRLMDAFERNAADDWPWPEDIVTYANAKLPHALILSGQWVPEPKMVEMGLRSLRWLVDLQIEDGRATLIGNDGWFRRGAATRPRFDQQPIEAMGLIEACVEAYRCTRDERWIDDARIFLRWFLGDNDLGVPMVDFRTGGCRDGLRPTGPNLNQGAESTLAWLIGQLALLSLDAAIDEAKADKAARKVETPPPAVVVRPTPTPPLPKVSTPTGR